MYKALFVKNSRKLKYNYTAIKPRTCVMRGGGGTPLTSHLHASTKMECEQESIHRVSFPHRHRLLHRVRCGSSSASPVVGFSPPLVSTVPSDGTTSLHLTSPFVNAYQVARLCIATATVLRRPTSFLLATCIHCIN
jgi:hypothetical protein